MSRAEAEDLADAIAEGKALPKEVVAHVVKHGEGVPLHLEQLTRSVLSADVLELSADGCSYTLTGNLSELALPTTLENAIRANMDALFKTEPKVKLLLELATVLGGEFTLNVMKPLWTLAEGGDDESLNKAVMIAMKKKMLTSMSSKGYLPIGRNRKSSIGENMRFQFVHLRILDVCRSGLLKQHKMQLHGLCFAVLSSEQMSPPTEPAVLGLHLRESGRFAEAGRFYHLASEAMASEWRFSMPHTFSAIDCFELAEAQEPLPAQLLVRLVTCYNYVVTMEQLSDELLKRLTATEDPDWNKKLKDKLADKLKNVNKDSPPELLAQLAGKTVAPVFGLMFGLVTPAWAEAYVIAIRAAKLSELTTMLRSSPDFDTSDDCMALSCFAQYYCGGWVGALNWERPELQEIGQRLGLGHTITTQYPAPIDLDDFRAVVALNNGPHERGIVAYEVRNYAGSGNLHGMSMFLTALCGDLDLSESLLKTISRQMRTTFKNELDGDAFHKTLDYALITMTPMWFMRCAAEAKELFLLGEGWHLFEDDSRVCQDWFDGMPEIFDVPDGFFASVVRRVKHGLILCDASVNSNPFIGKPGDSEYAEGTTPLPDHSAEVVLACEQGNSAFNPFPRAISAAEVLLKLGRLDDALEHAEFALKHYMQGLVPAYQPWLKGRILGAMQRPQLEVFAQLEGAVAAAARWESPLLVALALQDMMALCPAEAARGDTASRYEEACFDLTMEHDCPMKTHLASKLPFSSSP